MGPARAPGDAQDGPPGVHVPIGRAQAGEGRHHHHAAGIRHGLRQAVALRGRVDEVQLVPKPLNGAAAVENAALQGIGRASLHLPGNGRHQARPAADGLFAHVHQGEAAGAVCILGLAGAEAGLAEQGGLLIPRRAAHRRARQLLQTGNALFHQAVHLTIGHRQGQNRHRDAQQLAQLRIPAQTVDIKEHGAGGVGIVRHMGAGQLPDEPRFHRAEQQVPPVRLFPGAGDVIQHPADLGGGEVGVDQQAGGGLDALLQPLALQLLAQLRRAAALPHDGVVHRPAGGLVPENGGLPLVGDADAGNVRLQALRRLGRRPALRLPDLHGVMLHPAGLGIKLAEGILGLGHNVAQTVEHDGPGAGGPLVQRQNVRSHRSLLFLFVSEYDNIDDYSTGRTELP